MIHYCCLAHESDARRRMISKSFHHQLKVSERQAVAGPPESMREHVVAASKAMRNGLWKHAHNFIINEKMNAKVYFSARELEFKCLFSSIVGLGSFLSSRSRQKDARSQDPGRIPADILVYFLLCLRFLIHGNLIPNVRT